ncbi:hypothetical protein [Sphingobacterium yanglingense]|uniref:Uncharacterized protein n=1 Tax=Sphingobacterium yanglingense TaxID=1437280 RepID=A0A4R6W819_9SPHI|nr:hypothetical protein [Sphingobacterium yanglingense]TDQ73402.1 hypothetical protein CLV99_4454 [Sphingobacterium yanglingense]
MFQRLRFYILLFVLLTASLPGTAQITFGLWSNNYIELTSYLGQSTHARFNTFQFQMGSQSNINYPNWSLSVQLLRPIQPSSGGPNKSGKPFPADKISFRWTEDDNKSILNLNEIGASRNDIFLANSGEIYLIERSNQALRAEKNFYSSALLFGMVKIAQGKYLEDFVSGVSVNTHIEYDIPLKFTLYEVNGKVIGTQVLNYKLHIPPTLTNGGAVEVVPDYSLQVDAGAIDASLQFFTRQHYIDGVKLMVDNAIRVNSNTDYELRVKSLDPEIRRSSGEGLPLSLLSLQVIPNVGAGNTTANPKIQLSTTEQVAYSGQSKDKNVTRTFNIQYEANLTRSQSLTARPGNYTVSLLYLLMPK